MGTYLEDLRSDFSAIHRIDPDTVERMPAPRAYALAYRLSAYQSVLRGRWHAQQAAKVEERASVPREMSAAEWLTRYPQHLEKVRRERKG